MTQIIKTHTYKAKTHKRVRQSRGNRNLNGSDRGTCPYNQMVKTKEKIIKLKNEYKKLNSKCVIIIKKIRNLKDNETKLGLKDMIGKVYKSSYLKNVFYKVLRLNDKKDGVYVIRIKYTPCSVDIEYFTFSYNMSFFNYLILISDEEFDKRFKKIQNKLKKAEKDIKNI